MMASGKIPEVPPIQFPEEYNSEEWSGFIDIRQWNCNWQLVRDNQFDPIHGSYLHTGTHILSGGKKEAEMGFERTNLGFIVWRKNQQGVNLDKTWLNYFPGSGFWAITDLPYPRKEARRAWPPVPLSDADRCREHAGVELPDAEDVRLEARYLALPLQEQGIRPRCGRPESGPCRAGSHSEGCDQARAPACAVMSVSRISVACTRKRRSGRLRHGQQRRWLPPSSGVWRFVKICWANWSYRFDACRLYRSGTHRTAAGAQAC